MKKIISLAGVFLLSAGMAVAQDNDAATTQAGSGNETVVSQAGAENTGVSDQDGTDNFVMMNQMGTSNLADITQINFAGFQRDHEAIINQEGSGNEVDSRQQGG
ncbi:MAG: hypothetical protein LC687_07035, partial [Actinobacteria bacterium]|nr:hypothetical protein [Actinomycetota bacterium]